jgi:hypothetical protein
MRLLSHETAAIKTAAAAAAEAVGATAVVRLLGSRVRGDLRGGVSDLLTEADDLENEPGQKARFQDRFWEGRRDHPVTAGETI